MRNREGSEHISLIAYGIYERGLHVYGDDMEK